MQRNKSISLQFIKKKIDPKNIERIARTSGFVKRQPKKIYAFDMLVALLTMVAQAGKSFTCLAIKIGLINGNTVSKQAVSKRANQSLVEFLKTVLAAYMMQGVKLKSKTKNKLFSYFGRVFLEDSTSIKLLQKLANIFPGSGNKTTKKNATVKIDATYELCSGKFLRFALHPFTRNDQKASPDILDTAKPFDLIIRDLGYFASSVFAKMTELGIFFLSRLAPNVAVFTSDGKTELDLVKELKKHDTVDIDVRITKKYKVPVRLVARKVPEEVAAKRRRNLRKNRKNKYSIKKRTLELLSWEIFVTNVDRDIWASPLDVINAYGFRWLIEVIFKSWKSNFYMSEVPQGNEYIVQSYIYAGLILVVLFNDFVFKKLSKTTYEYSGRYISLLRLSKFIKEHAFEIGLSLKSKKSFKNLIMQILCHCIYEERPDRLCFPEIFALS